MNLDSKKLKPIIGRPVPYQSRSFRHPSNGSMDPLDLLYTTSAQYAVTVLPRAIVRHCTTRATGYRHISSTRSPLLRSLWPCSLPLSSKGDEKRGASRGGGGRETIEDLSPYQFPHIANVRLAGSPVLKMDGDPSPAAAPRCSAGLCLVPPFFSIACGWFKPKAPLP